MPLTDEQWQLLAPLFPPPPPARGRPPNAARRVLEAVLWKLSTRSAWSDLPAQYPPYQTCYRYYHQWQRKGLLDRVLSILYHDLRTRGGLDIEQALRSGAISFDRQASRWRFAFPDLPPDAWQLTTAVILISLAFHKQRYGRL